MTLILSSALVLAATVDGLSLDHPVVGWHNVVTAAGIVADSAEANYPASNLANPATHLEWRAGQAGNQYLTITTGEVDPIDYVAVARHNWGSGEIPVSIEGFISGVWTEIVEETMLADDGPALWRFTGQSLSQIRIRLQASAGSVAGARTTTTISERDGGVVFAAAYTIVDMTKALIPGAIVSSIGIYSTLAGAFKVKIVKRNSVGNFDVVVSESFAHPGGGFVDHDLSSAYTIPSSGDYYLAALNDASISNDVALLISSRAFKIGDITGVAQSGFTEDGAAGHMLPMRYTYNALAARRRGLLRQVAGARAQAIRRAHAAAGWPPSADRQQPRRERQFPRPHCARRNAQVDGAAVADLAGLVSQPYAAVS